MAAGGISPQGGEGPAAVRQEWQDSFESTVLSAVLLVDAMRPQLEAAAGRVVLISSVAGLR